MIGTSSSPRARATTPQTLRPAQEAGAVALVIIGLLAVLTLLVLGFSHRNLVADDQASMNHYEAAQAHAMAEAGRAWMLAEMNAPMPSVPHCTGESPGYARGLISVGTPLYPSARPSGTLATQPSTVRCLSGDTSWHCECIGASLPAPSGPPTLPPTVADGPPAFLASLQALPSSRALSITATGCSRPGSCGAAATHEDGALAVVTQSMLLLPALTAIPDAPITVSTPAARPDALFRSYFGLGTEAYQRLPVVHRTSCAEDCLADLREAYQAGWRIFWVAGDLHIDRPFSLGLPRDPVLWVVDGQLALDASLSLKGMLYARSLQTGHASSSSRIDGALVAEAIGQAADPIDVRHDRDVLNHIQLALGPFAPIPGSWHEP